MGGKLGIKYNSLKRNEEFLVADAVKGLESPFPDWSQAISYFSKVTQRPISKANIVGICKDLNTDVSQVVSTAKAVSGPMANMSMQISDLRRRVEAVEAFISGLQS